MSQSSPDKRRQNNFDEPMAREWLRRLHNSAPLQVGFIIGCGPSILEYDWDALRPLLSRYPVISIKQSIVLLEGIADFHLINRRNLVNYSALKSAKTTTTIAVHSSVSCPPELECDFSLPIHASGNLVQSLATRKDFDRWTLDLTPIRPWGPGILNELGFYLAAHLGLQRIITIGWDLQSRSDNTYVHFYDVSDSYADLRSDAPRRPDPVAVDEIIALSGGWHAWLGAQGIELVCGNTSSFVHSSIPRKSIYEIFDEL